MSKNYLSLNNYCLSTKELHSSKTVKQITFFEVDSADIRTILEIANFPDEIVIEEALSFEGELNEPIYGDIYATEYHNDV